MNRRKPILIAILAFAAVAIFGVTAWATTGAGFVASMPARGTLSGAVHYNADRLKFQTKDDADIVASTVTYAPGGYSGWHTHPGFVLVVVQSGAINITVGCSANTYSMGQAFTESGTTPIMARNLGAVPAVVRITYVVPKGSATRLDASAPAC